MVELPLFPLHTVLFPGGRLGLRVFEKRYRDMVSACLKHESLFGICLIRAGHEVGTAAEPHAVGTTARILACDVQQPGILHIRTSGEQRFRVLRTRVQHDQLLLGEVEMLADPQIAGLAERRALLERLLEAIGDRHEIGTLKLDDPVWVNYRLAELLPLANAERQELLEYPEAQGKLQGIIAATAPGLRRGAS